MTTENESERSPAPPVPGPLYVVPPPPELQPWQRAPRSRPASVIVIGILCLVGAAVEVLVLVLPTKASHLLNLFGKIDDALFFIVLIVMGIGLLRWQPWARKGTIVTIILRFLISAIYSICYDSTVHPNPLMSAPVWRAIYLTIIGLNALYFAVLIFFLTRPGVKAAFE